MFPIDVLRFSEFRTIRNHLSETLMLNDIQITSDYMSRWVVLKRRVGAVTSQRVLKVLFYVNILQCFFAVENFTANAVSVAIRDNGNRLIFEIWWNFFYNLFSIKNVADVNSIDSFVSKRNMEEFSVVIMKRFRSNWLGWNHLEENIVSATSVESFKSALSPVELKTVLVSSTSSTYSKQIPTFMLRTFEILMFFIRTCQITLYLYNSLLSIL